MIEIKRSIFSESRFESSSPSSIPLIVSNTSFLNSLVRIGQGIGIAIILLEKK